MSRFLVFGRIEAGVVGERDLFAAIVIDALCESLHKLFAALTGRSGDDEDGFAVGGQLGTVALDEGVARSILLSTIQRGFAASAGSYFSSSSTRALAS